MRRWIPKRTPYWMPDWARIELEIMGLWCLSCEDLKLSEGGCKKCEFKEDCERLQGKLFGEVITNKQ